MCFDRMDDAAKRRLQESAQRKVHDVIRRVDDDMSGQPVDAVHAELMTRLRQAGVDPHDTAVREYSQSISDASYGL